MQVSEMTGDVQFMGLEIQKSLCILLVFQLPAAILLESSQLWAVLWRAIWFLSVLSP